MSAFVVGVGTIDVMVAASLALFNPTDGMTLGAPGGGVRLGDRRDANRLGRLLWAANVTNIAHLYGREETADDMDAVLDYSFTPVPGLEHARQAAFLSGRIAAVIDCFDYQCCDIDSWMSSDAYYFICRLRCALLSNLPGHAQQGYSPVDRATFGALPAGVA